MRNGEGVSRGCEVKGELFEIPVAEASVRKEKVSLMVLVCLPRSAFL